MPRPRSFEVAPIVPTPEFAPPLLAIFDHDGVLVDSLDLHQRAWVAMGVAQGLPITAGLIHETFGMTNPAILRRVLGPDASDAEIARLGDLKEARYRDLARGRIALMDGVRDLLDDLSRLGVRLAIGSSSVRANLELTIAEAGLLGRFASIATLEDIRRGKPDPEVFLLAAERAGVEPRHAAVFEDAVVGIRAAKAAGMRAVGVTTTHPAADLAAAGADLVVEALADFDAEGLVRALRGEG